MGKIKEFVSESNHWKHIIACFIISILSFYINEKMGLNLMNMFVNATFTIVLVSIAVEYKDYLNKGTFSFADLFADLMGGACGIFLYLLSSGLLTLITL